MSGKKPKKKLKEKPRKSQSSPSPVTPIPFLDLSEEWQEEEEHEDEVVNEANKLFLETEQRESDDATRLEQLLIVSRARKQSFWETVCYEVGREFSEMDLILQKLGLPAYNYRKDKTYDIYSGLDEASSQKETCISRVYLDDYIFPHLLPAIQALIRYAQQIRAFQNRACIFNPLDYMVEFLYNNNPLHPERRKNLTPVFEIPFAVEWLKKFPRPPIPKWFTMSEIVAAITIQQCFRRWLARKKARAKRDESKKPKDWPSTEYAGEDSAPPANPSYTEIRGESYEAQTHSQDCFVCTRFRQFLQEEEKRASELDPPVETVQGETTQPAIDVNTEQTRGQFIK